MSRTDVPALATAAAIAERLADPQMIRTSNGDLGVGRRRPQSLAGGAAGIALLHIERARSGHGDWSTAHAWLAAAASEELSAGSNANLFFGAPTLAFVTLAAVDRPGRYERPLAELDASTVALTRRRLAYAHARIDRGDRPVLAEFDLIRGLAGLGIYHLRRGPHHDITLAVLGYLVRLTEPLAGRTDRLPGWWTDVSPDGSPSSDFLGGHGNFGMSHGIAGPLAVLSLALRCDVAVDGQAEAISRICAWLDAWRQHHAAGPWWPGFITAEDARRECVQPSSRQRPSWCYGTPGLARAQQLAGIAIDDTGRQRTAENAMLACLRDPEQRARITDSGLCHGTAGAIQAAWRMASDADNPDIAIEAQHLAGRLRIALRSSPEDVELFDGMTGAALALHTVGTDTAPLSGWDSCLLLA